MLIGTINLSSQLIDKLVGDYLANKQQGKSVIFAPNHKIGLIIKADLESKGRTPAYLSTEISNEEQELEIQRFEKGDAEELINVDIATEGYDFPDLRNVVDFDTNGSETQWVQKVGRGLRIAEGKTGCTVIDFGGNLRLYPDVEIEVNLEGEFKTPEGKKLCKNDFFIRKPSVKEKEQAIYLEKKEYTPYSLPIGWESLNDDKFGIVYAFSGSDRDAIVVKKEDKYCLFKTDKTSIEKSVIDSFNECITQGDLYVKETSSEIWNNERLISKMQIKKLSPKYPTMTLTWHSANCIICWECWKKVIENEI